MGGMELSVWATAVGIVAGVLSVLIAVDQLTASARDRRLAEFLMRAAEFEDGAAQRTILVSLARVTVARLVARAAVPSWQTALAVISSVLLLMLAYLFGSFTPEPATQDEAFASFAAAVMLCGLHCLSVFVVIGHMRERGRIAAAFLDGKTPVTRETSIDRGSYPWWVVLRGAVLALGTFTLAGVVPYVARRGADPTGLLGAVLLVAGLVYGVVHKRPRRKWSHPEAL